jgi:beta-galactosidase
MKYFLALTLSIMLFSNAYANQESFSLNGVWRFCAPAVIKMGTNNTIEKGFSTVSWDSIQVPGNWDVENKYANFVGDAAYLRTFELPLSLKNEELFINFDAVYFEAKVYLNGNYVGKHEGGYTPFEFCITDLVKKDKPNTVVVLVNNEFSRGAWWSWGGISRNVYISKYDNIRLNQLHVSAIPDFKTGLTTVNFKTKIENLIPTNKTIDIEISFDNNLYQTQKFSSIINASDLKTIARTFSVPTKSVKLWHFDTPNLYTAAVNIYSDKKLIETKTVRFGIRKVEVRGTQFLLNNEPIRAFGFNRVADHRSYGNTEPIEIIKRDIDNMKSMGCVLTRMIHHPQSPELLDYCDEKGMLIISEIPVWSKFDPNSFSDNPMTKFWLDEMIERDFNHPSIIGWSVANELGIDEDWKEMKMSKEQFRYVSSMIRHIKAHLDTTRLITYSSFTVFRQKASPENEPASLCDFISFNSYGDMLANCKDIHTKWPDKPIFISEFGRGQIGENLNTADIAPIVVKLMGEAQQFPYLMGASLWTYNDYRSRYKGTPPSENRSWGVVDVWRNKKPAALTIHKMFSPIKDFKFELSGNTATVSFYSKTQTELPTYKLNGYAIQFTSSNGKSLQYPLEVILPNGKLIKQTYNLKNELFKGNFVMSQLISPTGIAISEQKIATKKMEAPLLINSVANNKKMQVEFTSVSQASKYVLKYNNSEIQLMYPKFELPLDSTSKTHAITLFAFDDKGNFSKSKTYNLKIQNNLLPPVIQAVVKDNNKYTIGYTVEKNDKSVDVEYTTKNGVKTVSSELKGSFKIYEKAEIISLRIRKNTSLGTSEWSKTINFQPIN